jgi:hypothetical protein
VVSNILEKRAAYKLRKISSHSKMEAKVDCSDGNRLQGYNTEAVKVLKDISTVVRSGISYGASLNVTVDELSSTNILNCQYCTKECLITSNTPYFGEKIQ